MSLTALNLQAVAHLHEGRSDEGVSLLLEAFDRLDLLNGNHQTDNDDDDDDGYDDQEHDAEDTSNNCASSTNSHERSALSGRYSTGGSHHSYVKRVPSPRGISSTSRSSDASSGGRYKEAIDRATESHGRLSQSRSSLDTTTTNTNNTDEPPLIGSVGSDLSALSEDSSCVGEENPPAELLPSRSDVTEQQDDESSSDTTDESQEASDVTSTSGTTFAGPSVSLQSVALPKFHNAATNEEENQPVSDNIFTFYQRAFILTSTEEEPDFILTSTEEEPTESAAQDDDANDGGCAKQKAVLLYNMGVAHHNYAMSSWNGPSLDNNNNNNNNDHRVASHREFRTALVFYDMCFNIIQDSWSDDEDFLLLLLAVWNNMGHIHAHRYNYLETQEMLSSLQEILQVICSSPPLLDTMNDDFLFFYKNLVVYEEQEFAAAPAA